MWGSPEKLADTFRVYVRAGVGGGFRPGRVCPPGPGRPAASPSLSLSRLELLSFGGTVEGRRAEEDPKLTHRVTTLITDSLPGAGDTNHNYKTQPESQVSPSDISGDTLSDHSPVTDLNTASGGRKAEKIIASRVSKRSTWL